MKKKKLKLDLKKITIAKLSDKSSEKIKGGTGYSFECYHPSVGSGSTCVFGYVNGIYECLRDS